MLKFKTLTHNKKGMPPDDLTDEGDAHLKTLDLCQSELVLNPA
ncbi:hypothetical protein AM1_F0106 (plasmid) [Acaryochloris marina MBIC11017]|uniref:Uncharacterized protein n=1 Tax=Acaryochloris marina (strain MBIC 11017) TaxID=329726 RepID=A8ZQ87_ACAM1|nr:hypothetical protein AM1_F0106 [Acaryochloris marina MBIC11017]